MRPVSFGRALLCCCAAVCVLTMAAEGQRAPNGRPHDGRKPPVSISNPPSAPHGGGGDTSVPNEGGIAGAGIEPLSTLRVAANLAFPVGAVAAPGDTNHLYIIQKGGLVRSLNLTTGTISNILTIAITGATSSFDERGLLGIAFHPNYPTDPYVYFNFTLNSPGLTTFVRRYTVTNTASDPIVIDAGSAFTIIRITQPFSNHNGGWIGFGPNDGYLYVAMGDGGDGCDPAERAQDITDQLLGKILRIDVNSDDFPAEAERNYAIPADNPFVGVTGDDEIWAYGVRNPWRNGFDSMTGDLFIADVGQFTWEEVNFQPASSAGGENYGWDCNEGFACTSATGCSPDNSGCVCNAASLVDPIGTYSHSGAGNQGLVGSGCSITGGMPYRGNAIPTLQGTYFYADVCNNIIGSLSYDGVTLSNVVNRTAELAVPGFSIGSIVSFGEDALGEMYIVDQGSGTNGEIFKIIPAEGACCLPNGSCLEDQREADCLNAGGTWNKNETCAQADCPVPTGACCLSESSCVVVTEATCGNQGGIYHGHGTTCGGDLCLLPRGACCLSDGQCIDDVTVDQCALFAGSTYQGDDTLCADVECSGEATGACCLGDGSCLDDVSSVDCAAQGGNYQGDDTVCSLVECPQPTGACCLGDGSCVADQTAGDCAAQSGTYQGDDSDCGLVVCPQPTGACCLTDGSCLADQTAGDCAAQGGTYQGDASDCGIVVCPQPTGACCLGDGSCLADQTASDCAAQSGTYQGDGSDCGLVECPQPCLADFVDSDTFAPPPDGVVDAADLAFLLGDWGPANGSPADIVDSDTFAPPPDGVVDAADLAFLLGEWGPCE